MKRFALLSFLLLTVAPLVGCGDWETLESGSYGHYAQDKDKYVVIHDDVTWKFFYSWNTGGAMPAPEINFDNNVVLGVLLSMRPSGGYGVEITSVNWTPGQPHAELGVNLSVPGPGEFVTLATTLPYALVRVPAQPWDTFTFDVPGVAMPPDADPIHFFSMVEDDLQNRGTLEKAAPATLASLEAGICPTDNTTALAFAPLTNLISGNVFPTGHFCPTHGDYWYHEGSAWYGPLQPGSY